MIKQRWFGGLFAAMLYVAGVNDEVLHHVSNWWLGLPQWSHIVIVLAVLALGAWVAARILGARRAAYGAAVHAAAAVGHHPHSTKESVGD